jgi:ABC-type multidrug transport system fused ATPase/permease subunit
MKKDFSLKGIFLRFKWKMSLTFILLILENLGKVIQPLVLGIAINDLLEKKHDGVYLFSAIYLLGFLIATVRRYLDTRIYTKIYSTIASEMTFEQIERDTPISTVTARSSLIKELVDFFEHDLTQAISSLINVIGALVMIAIIDINIFIGCLISIAIIVLIYMLSSNKILHFNVGINNELEKRVDVLESKNTPSIIRHYRNISKWMVKLSDIETLNFGIIEIVLFSLSIFALYSAASSDNTTVGSIFSTLTYILEFSGGVFMLPIVFQQLIRLQEISDRISSIK